VRATRAGTAYVGSVKAGGPAAKAGLRVGETIVSVDGQQISTTSVLSAVLAELKPGQSVPVVVKSQHGTKTTLQVTLGTYPSS
jgi:S1-C subfamily serine protease